MSTTFLIGRWPAAISRCFSHSGEGPIFTSSKHARREARADLGVDLDRRVVVRGVVAGRLGVARGRVLGERRAGHARAGRAPRRTRPSGRAGSGVTSSSSTSSAIGRCSASGAPTGRSSASTMIPSWSSPMPTSSSARIMPLDCTPRSFASPSCVPSGMTAPGSATATVCPAATLGAPQTIVWGSPRADVDDADGEPVGVRVLLGLQHAARRGTPRCRRRRSGAGARACRPPS